MAVDTFTNWLKFTPANLQGYRKTYVELPAFSYTNVAPAIASVIVTQFNFAASKNFILLNRPAKPEGVNYGLCIRFRVGETVTRYKLWQDDAFVLNDDGAPLYTNQTIKKNFVLEVWSFANETVVTQATAIRMLSSVRVIPTDIRVATPYALADGAEFNALANIDPTLPAGVAHRWTNFSTAAGKTDVIGGRILVETSIQYVFFNSLSNISIVEDGSLVLHNSRVSLAGASEVSTGNSGSLNNRRSPLVASTATQLDGNLVLNNRKLTIASVDSAISTGASGILTFGGAPAIVTFSPVSDTIVPASGNLVITLTSNAGATIHCTIDGSDVTAGGASVISGASGLTVTIFSGQDAVIFARAELDGEFSAVTTAVYAPVDQLTPVIFSPATGASTPVNVALTGEAQTTIYYSTDAGAVAPSAGLTPASPWVLYSSPIAIAATSALLAQARSHPTKLDSIVSTAAYGLAPNTIKVVYVRKNVDRVGSWGVFTANNDPTDVQFNFFANFPTTKTIHCISFIDANAPVNGWSTWQWYTDVSVGNGTSPDFNHGGGVFPLVIDKGGVQLNFAHFAPVSSLTLSGQVRPGMPQPATWVPASGGYNNDATSPRGDLGNYTGLVNFALYGSNNSSAWISNGKTMKLIVYASDVGGSVVTRYIDTVTIP